MADQDPATISASAILRDQLEQWGIGQLYDDAMRLMKQGLTNEAIALQLQDTDAYKKRFAANEERRKKGLQALTPAEYVAVETQYKTIARQYGLPASFYDSPEDLQKFIANDMAPQEFNERVKMAQEVWRDPANEQWRQMFKDYYGLDLSAGQGIAHILDPERAEPVVQREINAARLGSLAARQEVDIDKQQAEYLDSLNVTEQQALQGFSDIARRMGTEASEAERFGTTLTTQEQVADQFEGLASARRKRERLNASEKALFDGRAATSGSALGESTTGSF